jgi:hypothetical protein
MTRLVRLGVSDGSSSSFFARRRAMLMPFNNAGLFGILMGSSCHREGTLCDISVEDGIFSFVGALRFDSFPFPFGQLTIFFLSTF